MTGKLRISIFTLLLTASGIMSVAKERHISSGYVHRITTEVRPAWNIPSNDYYWGYNDSGKSIFGCLSTHLKYSFSFPSDSILGEFFPGAWQGIGMMAQTFLEHDLTGTPASVFIFQGGKIADITPNLSIAYEWNLGISFGWKTHRALATSNNIFISGYIPFIWRFNSQWELSFGPVYQHFSNGDTAFPNGGTNNLGISAGITRSYGNPGYKAPGRTLIACDTEICNKKISDRIIYDILLYGGWRANRYRIEHRNYMLNESMPLFGLNFTPLYRLNRYFSTGLALDLLIDRSANLYDIETDKKNFTIVSYKVPDIMMQTALGVSLRGEFNMPIFTLDIGIGYNFIKTDPDIKGLYSLYNLKTRISKNLYLNFGYRLSSLKHRHNLMMGVGIRL